MKSWEVVMKGGSGKEERGRRARGEIGRREGVGEGMSDWGKQW